MICDRVMSTKVKELQMREWLRDYFEEKENGMRNRIGSHYGGLLILGALLGIIISYTSLVPFLIGGLVGHLLSTSKFLPEVDDMSTAWIGTVVNGIDTVFRQMIKRRGVNSGS